MTNAVQMHDKPKILTSKNSQRITSTEKLTQPPQTRNII